MGVLAGASANIALGTIAGMTIFLGLPVAKWRGASEQLKGVLALAAAGVLVFLIIEVGYHAVEIVESSAKSGLLIQTIVQSGVLIVGLLTGLVGLAALEEKRHKEKAAGATPLEIANMIAIGIGLHNFAEGLAIGQSFSGGQATLGLVLVIGFALHNATEGFGIAGPLVGQSISWPTLITLGLIAGAPTTLGALLGGFYINETLALFFLSLAVGSLIYVTRELLRLRFPSLSTTTAMSALALGLLVGIASELFVEVASAHSLVPSIPIESTSIRFGEARVEPGAVEIACGKNICLINETDKGLEIEGHGLIASEAFVPGKGRLVVKIIGQPGCYSLSPEGSLGSTVTVNVLPGEIAPLEDQIQTVAAITVLEGHVRAACDLHIRAVSGNSPHPSLDWQRAGKHAYHPIKELFEATGPKASMVQNLLKKHGLLASFKEKLLAYSQLAANKNVSTKEFTRSYNQLLELTEAARKAVGGQAYKTIYFRKNAALIVLSSAENEYREAVENGAIKVKQAAVPGQDGYLEYQDTRGFLQACRALFIPEYKNMLSHDALEAFSTLLNKEFASVDPVAPNHPTTFETIEALCERIEKGLS